MKTSGYRIQAVLFDFDGTLTRPGALNFGEIRQALGCPAGKPILEYIRSLKSGHGRRTAQARLDNFEMQGARGSAANDGAEDLVAWLKAQGLAVGIITRNSKASVLRALENFERIKPGDFDIFVTRDDPPTPKPSGDGVMWAAGRLKRSPSEMLVVGDFVFDTQAGQAAGALTALLDPDGDHRLKEATCDFRIQRLGQLKAIVRAGLPLAAGKLPNDLLRDYLAASRIDDPSVLIPPGVGEDVAAVDARNSDVLVLKSDPITFATDAVGAYAVIVNANDIATSGAVPRWFLTTLLLPLGTTASHARSIMQELSTVCRRWGISLCGGHTEITDAVVRPVVSGMMAGTVRSRDLIHKKNMRPGDRVVLTKGVAVEGTAIIARQFASRLRAQGVDETVITESSEFLEQISILPEARLAADQGWACAMHDVTEGGVATALEELSAAGGHRIAVDMETIPVLDHTRKICSALGLDPLGLIGSGSLLICCRPGNTRQLIEALAGLHIDAAAIGRVLEQGTGIEAYDHGKPAAWPRFRADEITRLFR